MMMFLSSSTLPLNQPKKGATPSELRQLELDVLEIVNKYREKKSLQPLKKHSLLTELAQEHSLKMAKGVRSFSHRGWDERADLIFEKVEVEFLAENIGYNLGQDEPAETVFDGWKSSSGHKSNMLNEKFDITGVGVAQSNDGTYYYTQIFASYLE